MSKVSYEIVRKDERLFFHDGKQYVLFDSGFTKGFGKNSVSVSGEIGPFKVGTMNNGFFSSFINMIMDDGKNVTAVLNPMDGYNCILKGNTITISDEETELPKHEYGFDFIDADLPLIEGSINGKPCRFFFDSGARMTMFGERSIAAEKVRSYKEWMAMLGQYAELGVYKLTLEFPNGFKYEGEGALVEDRRYLAAAQMMNIRAMLGIDIFNHYDMAIITKGAERGIYLMGKA